MKHGPVACVDDGPSTRPARQTYSLIVEHYNIDTASFKMRPDPMLHHDKNVARDIHDIFNLIVLLPVIILNLANWDYTAIRQWAGAAAVTSIPSSWHGHYFMPFWWTTCSYFVADVIFVLLSPRCVRSPSVIMKHHLITLAYICVPLYFREYEWLMGSCLLVEINTWLLIARRFFNRAGDKPFFSIGVPFTKSLRIKVISVGFYVTWFAIRIIGYPALMLPVVRAYDTHTMLTGTRLNALAIAPLFHLVFIILNFKWTVDLVRSKLRPSKRARRSMQKGL